MTSTSKSKLTLRYVVDQFESPSYKLHRNIVEQQKEYQKELLQKQNYWRDGTEKMAY